MQGTDWIVNCSNLSKPAFPLTFLSYRNQSFMKKNEVTSAQFFQVRRRLGHNWDQNEIGNFQKLFQIIKSCNHLSN